MLFTLNSLCNLDIIIAILQMKKQKLKPESTNQ